MNRINVIKAIKQCIDYGNESCNGCPYFGIKLDEDDERMCSDVMLSDVMELLEQSVQVIKCKDCKFNFDGLCDCEGVTSNALVEPNWFCADGERK